MKAINWWAWGFVTACLMVVILDRFGIHAGSYNSGLAVLVFLWCLQAANAFVRLKN